MNRETLIGVYQGKGFWRQTKAWQTTMLEVYAGAYDISKTGEVM